IKSTTTEVSSVPTVVSFRELEGPPEGGHYVLLSLCRRRRCRRQIIPVLAGVAQDRRHVFGEQESLIDELHSRLGYEPDVLILVVIPLVESRTRIRSALALGGRARERDVGALH